MWRSINKCFVILNVISPEFDLKLEDISQIIEQWGGYGCWSGSEMTPFPSGSPLISGHVYNCINQCGLVYTVCTR